MVFSSYRKIGRFLSDVIEQKPSKLKHEQIFFRAFECLKQSVLRAALKRTGKIIKWNAFSRKKSLILIWKMYVQREN